MALNTRKVFVALTWITASCATITAHSHDVLTVFLKQPSAEQFPSEDWCPQQRSELATEVATMNELMKSLVSMDRSKRNQIKKCYDDRALLVRELDAPAMRRRLKSIHKQHELILRKLRQIRWAKTPASAVRFSIEEGEQQYQFRNLPYLITLAALEEIVDGDMQAASNTLNAGFALAHNLTLTADEVSVVIGDYFKWVLMSIIGDFQSLGAPDLTDALRKLESSHLTAGTSELLVWLSISGEIQVLEDRPRTTKHWWNDLEASLAVFDGAHLMPDSDAKAEQIGRQLQTFVEVNKRIQSLSFPVQYIHGGVEGLKTLKPGEALVIDSDLNLPAIVKWVESRFENPSYYEQRALAKLSLLAARCIEYYRSESLKTGGWIDTFDDDFRRAIPTASWGKDQPEFFPVAISRSLPSCRIKLPLSKSALESLSSNRLPEAKIIVVEPWTSK